MRLVKADPQMQAKLAKMATKQAGSAATMNRTTYPSGPKPASSDKEILLWISQQAAQLGRTDSLLNEAAIGNDGSLLFVPWGMADSAHSAAR